jgi:hypothetical protein
MAKPTQTKHPLLHRPGSSQRKRYAEALALQPNAALLDERTLADLLDFVYRYARQVNFYDYQQHPLTHEAYQEVSNWSRFLENSLPIQLARLSKMSVDALEKQLHKIISEPVAQTNNESLQRLLNFGYQELISPVFHLWEATEPYPGFQLRAIVENNIVGTFSHQVRDFIQLHNAALSCTSISRRSYQPFMAHPWNINSTELFLATYAVTTPDLPRITADLKTLLTEMLPNLQHLTRLAPDFITESLQVYQGRHEPHLGLLFTFLQLFTYLKNDINNITKKHLDFFYQNVLRFQPKALVPDKAHLIFEIAQHLKQYPLPRGLLFKDGKDAKNADIIFGLDEEIVIDKAKVEKLQTLHLHPVEGKIAGSSTEKFVEGVYIAPVSNSADGKGEAFEENQSKNWATLGAKVSKYTPPGSTTPNHHPYGRIGFVLASPVLWLNEGEREIHITLTCDASSNPDVLTECFKKLKNPFDERYYSLTDSTIQKLLPQNREDGTPLLRDETLAYLNTLLAQQNPYPIGYEYDLQHFLTAQSTEQCASRFDPFERMPVCEALEYMEFKKCFVLSEDLKVDTPTTTDKPQPKTEEESKSESQPQPKPGDPKIITNLSQIATNRLQAVFELRQNLKYTFIDPIKIIKSIDYSEIKDGKTQAIEEKDKELIQKQLTNIPLRGGSIFKIALTGKDDWYEPDCLLTDVSVDDEEAKVVFDIRIKLEPGEPPIIFYDPEKHKEPYELKQVLPLVKIEVDPDIKVSCPNVNAIPDCDLEDKSLNKELPIALYHFFRHLTIQEAKIEVEVCGVKNVVVQNDENVQDVNKLILPFGVRPKLGANFYIGSKEIFCKDWQQVWMNMAWKDRPESFEAHYAAYGYRNFEDNTRIINDSKFKAKTAVLETGRWKENGVKEIFVEQQTASFCQHPPLQNHENSLHFIRTAFLNSVYRRKKIDPVPLSALTIDVRDAFLRLTLDGVSFQHDRYAFVLARQMFTLADMVDPATLSDAIANLVVAEKLTKPILDKIEALKKWEETDRLLDQLLKCINDIKDIITKPSTSTDRKNHSIQQLINALRASAQNSPEIPDRILNAITEALRDLKSTNPEGIIPQTDKRLEAIQENVDNLLETVIPILEKAISFDKDINTVDMDEDGDGLKELFKHLESTLGAEANEPLTDEDLEAAKLLLNDINELRTEINNRITTLDDNIDSGRGKAEIIQRKLDRDVNINTFDVLEDGVVQLFSELKKLIDTLTTNSTLITTSLDAFNQINEIATALEVKANEIIAKTGNSNLLIAKIVEIVAGKPQMDANGNIVRDANGKIVYVNGPQVKDEEEKLIFDTNVPPSPIFDNGLSELMKVLKEKINAAKGKFNPEKVDVIESGLANEPYTPTIQGFSLDYTAQALITDINLLHLYPFENTSKAEDIEQKPTLLPTFTDDGTLFIGLKELRPGANLHLLFQLAEATADSERVRAQLHWHYLTGNRWQPLRTGFELLTDGTDGLTVSGIVKIAVPGDITDRGNTVMPAGLFWIRVATPDHVEAVAEVIGVHAQAAEVTFQAKPTNDPARLAKPLPPNQVSKLVSADFSIKKIEQPYESFGGKLPEASGHFYTRISEHLRHKGRGIAPFDHEHLLLEAFPAIFKTKCVSHTFGLSARQYRRDLEVAPGFVVIAVIPDLKKLKAGDMLEPRAPVSLLEDIKVFLQKWMSPFARLQVMNPRYEKIQVDVHVTLLPGRDRVFYASQLREDLTHFLAPWYLGDSDKITFGQSIVHSDVVKFVENLDYIDFIIKLILKDSEGKEQQVVEPQTARSILTGGEICVTIIDRCTEPKHEKTDSDTGKKPFRFGTKSKEKLVN